MARTLPPLNAVRVFEAAARLGGFTKAGEELAMTQAAVSYQIRQLEDRLGTPLFVREARGVTLTEAGRTLARRSGEALDLIAAAMQEVRHGAQEVLTITVIPTFCSNWLVPRIGAFQAAHPKLAVRIDSRPGIVDIRAGEADIGIRRGRGDWPGLEKHFLFDDAVVPLVSPAAAERIGGIARPEDLLKLRLIGPMEWWRLWFDAVGCPHVSLPAEPALALETQTLEVSAAMAAGDAAVIVSPFYFQALLDQGHLLQPFETMVSDGRRYFLVYDPARKHLPKIRAFIEWLLFDPHAFCLNRAAMASLPGPAALTPPP